VAVAGSSGGCRRGAHRHLSLPPRAPPPPGGGRHFWAPKGGTTALRPFFLDEFRNCRPGCLIYQGRNRQTACLIAGVQPRYETCPLEDDAEIVSLVWSLNETRRHLTAGQRAAAAAKMEELLEKFRGEAKRRQKEAGSRGREGGRGRKKPLASIDAKGSDDDHARKTSSKIAAVAGVSARSIERAMAVKENAPDLFEKLEAGELSVWGAFASRFLGRLVGVCLPFGCVLLKQHE